MALPAARRAPDQTPRPVATWPATRSSTLAAGALQAALPRPRARRSRPPSRAPAAWSRAAITEVPGSCGYFLGGVVAYSDGARATCSACPASPGRPRRRSARRWPGDGRGRPRRFGADLAVRSPGSPVPTAASAAKPVGLTYIARRRRRGHRGPPLRLGRRSGARTSAPAPGRPSRCSSSGSGRR